MSRSACPLCESAGQYPEAPEAGLQTCDACEGSGHVSPERREELLAERAAVEKEAERIPVLMEAGHTYHCASRQVFGDGACECPGDGTGSPYHTMNPPSGGWPEPSPVTVPFDAATALRKLRTHHRISMGDAADALGLSVVQVSALETGRAVVDGGES